MDPALPKFWHLSLDGRAEWTVGDAYVRVDGVAVHLRGGGRDPSRPPGWVVSAPAWERGAIVTLDTLSGGTALEVMAEVDRRWPVAPWWDGVDAPFRHLGDQVKWSTVHLHAGDYCPSD